MSSRHRKQQWIRITIMAPAQQLYNRPLLNLLEHLRYVGVGDYRFEKDGQEVELKEASSVVVELRKPDHMKGEWGRIVKERVESFLDKAELFEKVM